MAQLEGKVSVVTGAASGIGEGIVRWFAAEGAKVVLADIDDVTGKDLAEQVGGLFVHCDVSVESEIAASVQAAVDTYGSLTTYVANAGLGGTSGPIDELDGDGFDTTVSVLLKGVALGMKHAVKAMKAGGHGGSIINTASVAGLMGGCGPHVYSACKAGVIGITRSVALEQAANGIRVNAICPGGIVTNIFGRGMGAEGEALVGVRDFMAQVLVNAQPIPRAGVPDDIAATAAFLASDGASFITGQALAVDGGMTSTNSRLMQAAANQAPPAFGA